MNISFVFSFHFADIIDRVFNETNTFVPFVIEFFFSSIVGNF